MPPAWLPLDPLWGMPPHVSLLQEFALKHKSDIRKDPEFRAQFHQVRTYRHWTRPGNQLPWIGTGIEVTGLELDTLWECIGLVLGVISGSA